ncbi:MAG: CHAT domain-containing tetratricopeptide repeat protein [Gammaproteobacteria bacterium]
MLLALANPATRAPAETAASSDIGIVADAQRLDPGQIITRSHGADARFRYTLQTDGNQLFVIEVEQRGLDLILSSTDPSGTIQTADSPLQRHEREVLVVGGSPGEYLIEIYSTEYTGAIGGHSITAFDPAAEPGMDPLRPYQFMMRGNALNFANEPGKRQEALAAYLTAANAWAERGREPERAWALLSAAGMLYWRMLRWQDAAAETAHAAAVYRDIGAEANYAAALHLEAASLMEIAGESGTPLDAEDIGPSGTEFDQARSLLETALTIQQRLGLDYDAAKTINNLGLLAYYRDNWEQAGAYWADAGRRFRERNEWTAELAPMINLGVLKLESGSVSAAVAAFTRVLELLAPGEQDVRADTLDNRARAYTALGNYDLALRDFYSALTIHRNNANSKGQGRSISGIATTYQSLGELSEAKKFYQESLVFREAAEDKRGVAATLIQLGNVCRKLGDFGCALKAHSRAARIAPNPIFRARGGVALAVDHLQQGNPEAALQRLEPAIATAQQTGARMVIAEGLLQRGKAYLALGQPGQARADLVQAQALFLDMGMTEMISETLYLRARSRADEGDTSQALELTGEAIDQIENVRNRLITPVLRATYLSHSQAIYGFQIELLMSATQQSADGAAQMLARKAFDTAERSRGRMLLDLMDEAKLDFDRTIDPSVAAERKHLIERMTELVYQRDRLLDQESHDVARLREISDDMDKAATRIRVLDISARDKDPYYSTLSEPRILDSRSIQQLLPHDTALLLYHLGEKQGFSWTLTDSDLRWRTLPGSAVLDDLARSTHISLQTYPTDTTARRQRDDLLAQLTDILLGSKFDLPGKKRLIIIPDGALHYVPFAALPLSGPGDSPRYLLSDYEILRVSSASAMALREETWDQTFPRSVAIFADPIVTAGDPRMPEQAASRAASQNWMTSLNRLRRLEWSGEEAAAIAELADPEHRLVLTGPAATREAVLDTDLRPYRFVHFATHSFIDTEYPSLSGLVLSPGSGSGPTDDLLQLDQISALSMNAEVAVLSACETALGREIRGEGLIGLTQGFILAGANQVIASLWRVPDRGTASLMALLYHNMMTLGQPASAALRNAQLELSGERRWADPYYWAGFILQTASAAP